MIEILTHLSNHMYARLIEFIKKHNILYENQYTVTTSSLPPHLTRVIYNSSRVLHTNQRLFKHLVKSTMTSEGKADGRADRVWKGKNVWKNIARH